jgi:hypothetical protein
MLAKTNVAKIAAECQKGWIEEIATLEIAAYKLCAGQGQAAGLGSFAESQRRAMNHGPFSRASPPLDLVLRGVGLFPDHLILQHVCVLLGTLVHTRVRIIMIVGRRAEPLLLSCLKLGRTDDFGLYTFLLSSVTRSPPTWS